LNQRNIRRRKEGCTQAAKKVKAPPGVGEEQNNKGGGTSIKGKARGKRKLKGTRTVTTKARGESRGRKKGGGLENWSRLEGVVGRGEGGGGTGFHKGGEKKGTGGRDRASHLNHSKNLVSGGSKTEKDYTKGEKRGEKWGSEKEFTQSGDHHLWRSKVARSLRARVLNHRGTKGKKRAISCRWGVW